MIGYATDFQLEKMFTRFYPEGGEEGGKKFCAQVRQHNKPVTAAQIQGLFLQHKDNPEGALTNIELLWKSLWKLHVYLYISVDQNKFMLSFWIVRVISCYDMYQNITSISVF